MTPTIKLNVSTCKLIADVVPRVLSVGLTWWCTVLLQALLHVPAFSFIKGVKEECELWNVWLCEVGGQEGPGLTDH